MDQNKLWKILRKIGIPDHLTCLLQNLYAGQEATVRKQTWIQGMVQNWEKSTSLLCVLSTCLFNSYAEYIMQNAGLDQAQAGIKIAGRNINNLDMQTTPPYGRKQRGTKEPVDEEERGE